MMVKSKLKKIALIGQPNVGKSSLFNRILKKRSAIISEISGTTRDIKKSNIYILDKESILIDTGGIDKTQDLIFSKVKENSINIAKESDIVLFIVDGKKLPDLKDRELFYDLQKLGKKLALVINKIDNDKEKDRIWDFFEFGILKNDIFGISVSHNRGIRALFDWIYDKLPLVDDNSQKILINNDIKNTKDKNIELKNIKQNDDIKVAIIGKVNVGKSSILNSLVGVSRSVVSSVAGTTIDPVDEEVEYNNKKITFVDTAGLRRKGKIEGIEKFALMRTREMLQMANIALFIIDASQNMAELDEKIAGLVDEFGLGTIIVLNKWDKSLDSFEILKQNIRHRFKFLYYAPIIAVSAKTNRSIDKLKDMILDIHKNYMQRIPTSKLNDLINKAVQRHSLPSPNGTYLKIYYTTQFDICPPRISIIMNKPKLLHFSYKRYLINILRKNIDLLGTPIHIVSRSKGERDENKEIKLDYS
jgi:GTPase